MTELKHSGRDYVYGFTKEIIDEVGPRLPGSEEEKIGKRGGKNRGGNSRRKNGKNQRQES